MSAAVASSSRASMPAPPPPGTVTLETLRQRLAKGKATRASLQADLARLEALQSQSPAQAATSALSSLAKELAAIEDRALLYRTAGITVFECDLDIGRRERAERREAEGEAEEQLGLGVRLETFWRGRFYEPYYLVFARPSQILKRARIVQSALDRGEAGPSKGEAAADIDDTDALTLIRHTIPAHIPLQRLVARYLAGQGASTAPASSADDEATAKVLELTGQPNLWLFLSRLHTHLQALVSRRQQASSLSSLDVHPTMLQETQPDGTTRSRLQAYSDPSFARHSIQWTLPPSVLSSTAERRPKSRKAEEKLDARTLLIEVTFDDVEADRLGAVRMEQVVSGRTSHVNGSVAVHLLTTPSPGALARKRRKGDDAAAAESVETTRKRRRDLEALLGKDMHLDVFVREVILRAAEM